MLMNSLKKIRSVARKCQFFISYQLEKALWATKFIQTIRNSPPSTTLYEPSLKQKLLNSTLDIPKIREADSEYEIDMDIASQMKEIFKDGVFISNLAYDQNRISKASIQQYTNELNQTSDLKSQSDINFTFIPNYLVTQQVFKYVLSGTFSNYRLFWGHYGSSKTTAFILLHYLTGIISQSLYQDIANQQKMINILIQNGQMVKLPHHFYLTLTRKDWNLDFANTLKQQISFINIKVRTLQDFIATQIKGTQTRQELHYSYFKYVSNQISLQCLEQKIPHLMIIDQIDSLVEECCNYNKEKLQQNLKSEKMSDQIDDKIQTVRKIVSQLPPVIFNSSTNISEELLKKSSGSNMKCLNLGMNHDGLQVEQLKYTTSLSKTWGDVSFKHYFRDQFEMKIKIIIEDKQKSEKSFDNQLLTAIQPRMRSLLNKFLVSAHVPHYLCFLNFRNKSLNEYICQFAQLLIKLEHCSQSQKEDNVKTAEISQIESELTENLKQHWEAVCSSSERQFIHRLKQSLTNSHNQRQVKIRMIFEVMHLATHQQHELQVTRRLTSQKGQHSLLKEGKLIIAKDLLSESVQRYIDYNKGSLNGSIHRELLAYTLVKIKRHVYLIFDINFECFFDTFERALTVIKDQSINDSESQINKELKKIIEKQRLETFT